MERKGRICFEMPGTQCGQLWEHNRRVVENLKEAVELFIENARDWYAGRCSREPHDEEKIHHGS